jgi:hypothetical protein
MAPDSERLSRAKDLIADEQWRRAIVELRAAVKDPAETSKDEANFWLAHSLFHAGDAAAALEAIEALERSYSRSRWLWPARSLRLEIAHLLNRHELLWRVALPPPPPPAAPPAPPAVTRLPAPPAAPAPAPPPAAAPALPVEPAVPAAPRPPRRRGREWVGARDPEEGARVMELAEEMAAAAKDLDLRIQALGSLMRVEPERAVPVLKEVALAAPDEEHARRAIFVLAQSSRRDAQQAVAEIARTGPEPVIVAAVRELGFARTPNSTQLLRDLYGSGSERVKLQVIRSLGEAGASMPLLEIVRAEHREPLRDTAISALGRAGARTQLAGLYRTLDGRELKEAIISALFTAGGERELRRIAAAERDPQLKAAALKKLELLKP